MKNDQIAGLLAGFGAAYAAQQALRSTPVGMNLLRFLLPNVATLGALSTLYAVITQRGRRKREKRHPAKQEDAKSPPRNTFLPRNPADLFASCMSGTYLMAFASLYCQIPGLYGPKGLVPLRAGTFSGIPLLGALGLSADLARSDLARFDLPRPGR